MFIEDDGFMGGVNAIMPHLGNSNEPTFRNNTHDENRPSGRKHQALAHQKFGLIRFNFGMTQFEQQNNSGTS